jgi:hypothetical protein
MPVKLAVGHAKCRRCLIQCVVIRCHTLCRVNPRKKSREFRIYFSVMEKGSQNGAASSPKRAMMSISSGTCACYWANLVSRVSRPKDHWQKLLPSADWAVATIRTFVYRGGGDCRKPRFLRLLGVLNSKMAIWELGGGGNRLKDEVIGVLERER